MVNELKSKYKTNLAKIGRVQEIGTYLEVCFLKMMNDEITMEEYDRVQTRYKKEMITLLSLIY